MCTQHLGDSSDRIGALSRSSSDTVNSEEVDSASLGILSELWYELLQESDVAILVLSVSGIYVYYNYFTRGRCLVFLTRFKGYVSAFRLPIMLEIVLMLMLV